MLILLNFTKEDNHACFLAIKDLAILSIFCGGLVIIN